MIMSNVGAIEIFHFHRYLSLHLPQQLLYDHHHSEVFHTLGQFTTHYFLSF